MTLTASQIRALNREPDHDPALNPDDGAARVRLGTILADLGDASGLVVVADASQQGVGYVQADVNEITDLANANKAAINLIMTQLLLLSRA